MNEMYEEKIRAIADEIEKLRLEMYPKAYTRIGFLMRII